MPRSAKRKIVTLKPESVVRTVTFAVMFPPEEIADSNEYIQRILDSIRNYGSGEIQSDVYSGEAM